MPDALPRRRWTRDAHEGLCALLGSSERPGVLALDWDETSMCGDISYALLDDLDRRAEEDLWARYGEWIRTDRLRAYKALARLILAGRTAEEVETWTRDVAEHRVARGDMAWVPEIGDLVSALDDAGWDIWVVTGSPTAVVRALAPTYGIHPDRVIGMSAPAGPDGRFEDALEEPVTWREGKATLIRARAGRAPTLALGDSEGDIALLRSARHAVWIDRGDDELAEAARPSAWWRQEAWR